MDSGEVVEAMAYIMDEKENWENLVKNSIILLSNLIRN